jgi:acetyl-CoA carboxylase alpha subunit
MLTTEDVKEALREALRIAKATGRLNQGVIRFAEDVGEIINIKAEEASS